MTRNEITSVLKRELDAAAMDEWLQSAGTKRTQGIDPIHTYVFKNRKITIVEDPTLHLGYLDDRVYLKPIPRELFNYDFWIKYMLPEPARPSQTDYKLESLSQTCRVALGFLRSYSFLIQHESDFNIAQNARVLPKDIPYSAFEDFISSFRFVDDEAVSKRYTYGQFHLSSESLRPWDDHEAHWGTAGYLKLYGAFALLTFVMLCPFVSWSQGMPHLDILLTSSKIETLCYYFVGFITIITLSATLSVVVGLAGVGLFRAFSGRVGR